MTIGFGFLGFVRKASAYEGAPGLENFGYVERQAISASFSFVGALEQRYLAAYAAAGDVFAFEIDTSDPDFNFILYQPGQGDGSYDQTDFVPDANPILRIVVDKTQPGLLEVTGALFAGGDGANGYLSMLAHGGALFQDDNDAGALIEGAWAAPGLFQQSIGGDGADILRGTLQNNLMWGFGGADKFEVKAGLGSAWGGDGDDRFKGNNKDDSFWGGDGDDFAQGAGGDDRFFGGAGNDELRGEENNDLLVGGYGMDLLKGGSGHDVLLGGFDADVLYGNDGNDVLLSGGTGPDGFDRLNGGSGKDVLWGQGNAIVHGGPGDDTFVFAPTPLDNFPESGATGYAAANDVRIDDFTPGKEKIYLVVSPDASGASAVTNFATLMTFAHKVGSDVVFDFGDGVKLTVEDVKTSQLKASDFIFAFPPPHLVDPLQLGPSVNFDYFH